jgi:hypothetical protein
MTTDKDIPGDIPDVDMDDDVEPVNPGHFLADEPTTEAQDTDDE